MRNLRDISPRFVVAAGISLEFISERRYNSTPTIWRDGRVVECGGFESRCPGFPDRGFESPSLRHPLKLQDRRYFFWIIEYDSLGDRYDVGSGGAVPQFSYFVESETRLFETGRFGNSPESVIAISES